MDQGTRTQNTITRGNGGSFNTLPIEGDSAALCLSADHPLEELFAAVRTALRKVQTGCAAVLHKAMDAGDALNAAEERVHRECRSWNRELHNNCFLSVRTARVYQRLARHRPEIEEAIDQAGIASVRAALRLIAEPKGSGGNGHNEDENCDAISEEREAPDNNQGEKPEEAPSSDQEIVGKTKKSESENLHTESPADHLNGGNADNRPTDAPTNEIETRAKNSADHLNGGNTDNQPTEIEPSKKLTMLEIWHEGTAAQRQWSPDGQAGELLCDLIHILETVEVETFRLALAKIPHLTRGLKDRLLNLNGLKRSEQLTKPLWTALRSNRPEEQLAALAAINKMLSADKVDFTDLHVRIPKSK